MLIPQELQLSQKHEYIFALVFKIFNYVIVLKLTIN